MLRVLAVCCVLLAAAPRPVAAEWHFIPMAGITFKGNTSLVDVEAATSSVHPNFGGAVALLGDGVLGAEAIFVMTPGFFERGSLDLVEKSRSLAFMGNAVLTLPRRLTEYSLRPYVSGGFGLVRASVETGVFPVASNLTGFNIGGGAVGFLRPRTGLRFDVRYYSSLNQGDPAGLSFGRVHLRYMTASVGVVIRR